MSSKAHRDILAEIADRKAWERSILRDALRGNLRVDPADAWFPGLEVLERAGRLLKQGGAEPQGSNHFDCPLPQLFAGCAMSGLGFAGRDAHKPGACEDPGGLTYHTRRVYTTDGETAGEHVTQPT